MGAYGAWSLVLARIESGVYDGRKVDWGGYAARVGVDEIRRFAEEVFPPDFGFGAPPGFPLLYAHLVEQLREFREFLGGLPDGLYYLVAAET